MTELAVEMLGYLLASAVLGLLFGYLIWGWGRGNRIAAARAEGAASASAALDRAAGGRTESDRLVGEVERQSGRRDHLPPSPAEPARPAAGKMRPKTAGAETEAGDIVRDPPAADEAAEEQTAPAPLSEDADDAPRPLLAASAPMPGEPPASLMQTAPAEPDDLKRISGIGAATERSLNENGIWTPRKTCSD